MRFLANITLPSRPSDTGSAVRFVWGSKTCLQVDYCDFSGVTASKNAILPPPPPPAPHTATHTTPTEHKHHNTA
ncbi:MAG: hypothetical protein LBQ76_00275, partial [Candidatus Fibromonas sp.]|nr:hypothetical protein [Candidatus Fibromonas sp.]